MLWADIASIPLAKAERCNLCCTSVQLTCSDFAHTETVSFDELGYSICNALQTAGLGRFQRHLISFPKPDFGGVAEV